MRKGRSRQSFKACSVAGLHATAAWCLYGIYFKLLNGTLKVRVRMQLAVLQVVSATVWYSSFKQLVARCSPQHAGWSPCRASSHSLECI